MQRIADYLIYINATLRSFFQSSYFNGCFIEDKMNIILPLTIKGLVDQEEVEIFPTLLKIGSSNYLVDCGYLETAAELENSLIANGVNIKSLDGVILTHDDHDHLGGLHYLKVKKRSLKIYCGKWESASISGIIKSERLLQFEASLPYLSGDQTKWALNYIEKLNKIPRFPVDYEFKDFELFEGYISVIHTPGHTNGHISLYLEKEKVLIAGDALVIQDGTFEIANPEYTLDLAAAVKSIEKIRALNPKKVYCYHGGLMKHDVLEKINRLISKYKSQMENL